MIFRKIARKILRISPCAGYNIRWKGVKLKWRSSIPVSDLRNYNTVLEQVDQWAEPVYLTVNGRGRYTIRDIADDEEFEKTKAMLRLMCEINEGRRSGEEEGWVSEEEVRAHFRLKRR